MSERDHDDLDERLDAIGRALENNSRTNARMASALDRLLALHERAYNESETVKRLHTRQDQTDVALHELAMKEASRGGQVSIFARFGQAIWGILAGLIVAAAAGFIGKGGPTAGP